MTYPQAITARRAFSFPGYSTLVETGFEGNYVSPIQHTPGRAMPTGKDAP